jgi:hypothetical protein
MQSSANGIIAGRLTAVQQDIGLTHARLASTRALRRRAQCVDLVEQIQH